MSSLITRFLRWLGLIADPGGEPGTSRDPYSRKPAPVRSGPKSRSGAVAVAEPEE